MPIQILQLESTTTDGVELKSYVCLPESASHDNPAPAIWWHLNGGASLRTHKKLLSV